MDELEISDKRYISTRRAAKDYNYSSDYIGQLLRGKKVLGRKVGRSWYAEVESLSTYLRAAEANKKVAMAGEGEESSAVLSIVDTYRAHQVTAPVPQKPAVVEKKTRHVELDVSVTSRAETQEERAYRVPLNVAHSPKKGLVYLSDDEPLLPMLEKKPTRESTYDISQKQIEIESEPAPTHTAYSEERARPRKHRGGWRAAVVLFLVGVLVTTGTTLVSVWMTSSITVEQGK